MNNLQRAGVKISQPTVEIRLRAIIEAILQDANHLTAIKVRKPDWN